MPVDWNGDAVIAAVRKGAFRGVVIATEAVLTEGTRLIASPPKTGRIYRRRGKEHQASAPGEPPATDTGRLIQSGRTAYNQSLLLGVVMWSTEYAAPLEFGTEKMEPRPYARPALANKQDFIVEAIKAEIERELQ